MPDKIAEMQVARFERHKNDRVTWDDHYREIAERVLMRDSTSFFTPEKHLTRGEKRTSRMFDATAAMGLDKFAAIMDSMLTPRNSRWHGIRSLFPEVNKNRDALLFFDEITRLLFLHRYSTTANFASQKHEEYVSLGAYGTGGLFIDGDLSGAGFRYKAQPLASTYYMQNHQGVTDTMFRVLTLSARQAMQKFPKERLHEDIHKALAKEPDKMFEFLHVVEPNEGRIPERKDFRGMAFLSQYIDLEHKDLVSEGGYRVFPAPASRYVTVPGESYGRSPAMIVLPAIKTLNEQKKTVLKQGHRVVDPVLLASDDGVLDGFSMRPGALNAGGVSPQGRALVQTLPVGNIAVGFEMMKEEQDLINDAFLVTLFQILTENPQMTATEVLERTREKGMLLSPTMGRQQSESIGPGIEREIDILDAQGLLPEVPDILLEIGSDYKVEYDSPLNRVQRAEETAGVFRSLELADAYSSRTGDLSVYDHFEMDEIMPAAMEANAVAARFRKSQANMDLVREDRQAQQQQEQAAQAAPALAGLVKAGATVQ